MKNALVKKAAESKLGTERDYSEPQKADTEASERVEHAAFVATDTVYHKGKTFAQNKIKMKARNNALSGTPEESVKGDNVPKSKQSCEGNEQHLGGTKRKKRQRLRPKANI